MAAQELVLDVSQVINLSSQNLSLDIPPQQFYLQFVTNQLTVKKELNGRLEF